MMVGMGHTGGDKAVPEEEEFLLWRDATIDQYSCLSDYVSALVVVAATDHDTNKQEEEYENDEDDGNNRSDHQPTPFKCVLSQGSLLIDWQKVPSIQYFEQRAQHGNLRLNSNDEEDDDSDVMIFRQAAFHLRQWSQSASHVLNHRRVSIHSLIDMHEPLLKELNVEKSSLQYLFDIGDHSSLTDNGSSGENIRREITPAEGTQLLMQFSVFSTFVERLIASAFKTVRVVVHGDNEDQVNIPATLTEILATDELKEVLDEKVIFVVSAFMGRPTGLNLRNITWHGFIESTGHMQLCYVQFLVILYLSLCSQVINWTKEHSKEFIWKKQLVQNNDCFTELYSKWLSSTDINQSEMRQAVQDAKGIVQQSFFVPLSRKKICEMIFDQYEKALECNDPLLRNRYLHNSLALLFPQMEHLLRIVFVALNPVKENMLRAESRELFSTLDILLHPLIDSDYVEEGYHDDLSNRIGHVLGWNLTDSLLDLFIHYQGPRLRDKVAHNEIEQFSSNLALHFLMVFVCIAKRLTHEENETAIKSPIIRSAIDTMLTNKGHVSCYDIRVQFISSWNQAVQTLSIFVETIVDRPFVKELHEYTSTFSKNGYSLKKGGIPPDNNRDITQLIESQFHLNSKLPASKCTDFTCLEIQQYLTSVEDELKGVETVIGDDYRLPEHYRDHFYASAQHISNVTICKKILEEFLLPIRTALPDKLFALIEMINNRTARTNHRKIYTTLTQCIPLLETIFKILLLILRRQYSKMQEQQADDETSDRQIHGALMKLLTNTERLYNSVLEGSFGFEITRIVQFLVSNKLLFT